MTSFLEFITTKLASILPSRLVKLTTYYIRLLSYYDCFIYYLTTTVLLPSLIPPIATQPVSLPSALFILYVFDFAHAPLNISGQEHPSLY